MKKLKVTWQDGSWNRDGDQPLASAEVHGQSKVSLLGETLVFQEPGSERTVLIISEQRLISAVEVEVAE